MRTVAPKQSERVSRLRLPSVCDWRRDSVHQHDLRAAACAGRADAGVAERDGRAGLLAVRSGLAVRAKSGADLLECGAGSGGRGVSAGRLWRESGIGEDGEGGVRGVCGGEWGRAAAVDGEMAAERGDPGREGVERDAVQSHARPGDFQAAAAGSVPNGGGNAERGTS